MSEELKTEKVLTQEGSIEFLEEIRQMLKNRLTVSDYERSESHTDDHEHRLAVLKNTKSLAYLHGFIDGAYMLADVTEDLPFGVIGMIRVNDVRDVALKMILLAIKQSIETQTVGGDS